MEIAAKDLGLSSRNSRTSRSVPIAWLKTKDVGPYRSELSSPEAALIHFLCGDCRSSGCISQFRLIGSRKIWERGAALTSRLQSFETGVLTREENFAGLAALNRELVARTEAIASPRRVVLDVDSTEVRGHARQEQSAYNGHFESTCYHPLLLIPDC
jgi:hypothetical protein